MKGLQQLQLYGNARSIAYPRWSSTVVEKSEITQINIKTLFADVDDRTKSCDTKAAWNNPESSMNYNDYNYMETRTAVASSQMIVDKSELYGNQAKLPMSWSISDHDTGALRWIAKKSSYRSVKKSRKIIDYLHRQVLLALLCQQKCK